MLKKPITFTDFDGNTVTRDYYFNLTKAELLLREVASDGTWADSLSAIAKSNLGREVIPEFEKLIGWCYGVRDGEEFLKSPALFEKFKTSEAYSVLIMEFVTDPGAAADFFTKVMPADLQAKQNEANAVPGFRPGADTTRPTPPVAGVDSVQQPQTRRELRQESQPRTDLYPGDSQVQ